MSRPGKVRRPTNPALSSLLSFLPTLQAIIVPNAVSWLCMWLSSLLLAYGLRQKERVRDTLLASGAVWTMHEQVARRLRLQDQDELRRKIDNLSGRFVA